MAPERPVDHLVLTATSVADDLGYVALADVAELLEGKTYRIIGGQMVTALAARWRLGAELYRETGDTDLGIPPVVVRDTHIIQQLRRRGYEPVAGNRFARTVEETVADGGRPAIHTPTGPHRSRSRQHLT